MNEQLQNLSKIFIDKLLRIPDYQRGYAWSEKHLNDFWGDLILLEEGGNHYAGVITLDLVPPDIYGEWKDDLWIIKSRGYTPYYVVDGQQRLTTSIILIQCILESFPKGELLNFTSLEVIRKRFIYEAYDEAISRAYIFGYEKDNPSHEFLKTRIFLQHSDEHHNGDDTIYTHNLEFAKQYFMHHLSCLGIKEIEDIYRKLTQSFLFNIYSISSEIDIHVSFETMNNRGKPLSHLELLKNRLIYLSTRLEDHDYEKDKLRETINSAWSSIYHHLGKNKDNPLDDDTFLRGHFALYFDAADPVQVPTGSPENPGFRIKNYRKELLENIFTIKNLTSTKNVDTKFIYEYVKSLKNAIETWYRISNPKDPMNSKEEAVLLTKIHMLAGLGCNQIIMAVFLKETSKANRLKFLELLEKLLFVFSFITYRGQSVQEEFVSTAEVRDYYTGANSFEKLISNLQKTVDSLTKDSRILIFFNRIASSTAGFYRWSALKYFLYEYEQSLKSQTKNSENKLDEWWLSSEMDDSIEHIYPQKADAECWKNAFNKLAPTDKATMKHTLGNLVPINRRKNSALRNGCFETKKGSAKKKTGYRYGTYSEIELCENDSWGPQEIIQRTLVLLHFMEKRWQIKFGTDDDKLTAIGLGKINKKINGKP